MKWTVWITLVLVSAIVLTNPGAGWLVAEPVVSDPGQVYYGDSDNFAAPAVIDGARVFAEIKEYKKLIRERHQEDDAEYWILLTKASERFQEAIADVARDHEIDLVAEIGTVTVDKDKELPDLTELVIAEIKSGQ